MSEAIQFHSEGIDFQLENSNMVAQWVNLIVQRYQFDIQQIDYIFCSDEYLLEINREQLQHDYYTDIITFPYHDQGSKSIMGDLFISVDRVKENASEVGASFVDELHRVMIHGVLHMLGHKDKTTKEATEMRRAEDLALALRMF
jgi:probable rRNA maturation factor